MDFGHYTRGEFSVGVEGRRIGSIIDLGSAQELQARYGYRETIWGGQGLASLRIEAKEVRILADYEDQSTHSLGSIDSVFGEMETISSAPIHVGHTYLVRLSDRHDTDFQRIVKFLVLRHEPDISVTLRWQVMWSSEAT